MCCNDSEQAFKEAQEEMHYEQIPHEIDRIGPKHAQIQIASSAL